MDKREWKATIVMSADHAGINTALGSLEITLLRGLSCIEDPRKVRDWLRYLCEESTWWCEQNNVDMRGWMERTRKRVE